MSTRSTIAILRNDGTVLQTYCHWDGYLSHNGQLLYLNYQDPKKVEKLISIGNISSLDKEVDIPPGVKHSFDTRVEGITTFYGRDRGEEDTNPQHFNTLADYMDHGQFEGYDYLFKEKNETWYLVNDETKKMTKLLTAMKKDKECVDVMAEVKAKEEKALLVKSVALSDKPTRQVQIKV